MEKELMQKNRKSIATNNSNCLMVVYLAWLTIYGGMFIASFFAETYAPFSYVYLLLVVVVLLQIILLRYTSFKDKYTFFYVSQWIGVLYCALSSAFFWPDSITVSILAVQVLYPILFIDFSKRINTMTILAALAYLGFIYSYKNPTLFIDEGMNVAGFTVVSIFLGNFLRKKQLTNYENEERIRMSKEEFRIALTLSRNIMCEYNIAEKTIYMTKEMAEALHAAEKVVDVPASTIREGRVAKDSIDAFTNFFGDMIKGKVEGHSLFYMRFKHDFRWMDARFKTIYDGEGEPLKAIVALLDVTEQHENEIRTKEKIEKDSLTGVLNREGFINEFHKVLSEQGKYSHALLLLDIDHFKDINDTMGHIKGDEILFQTAQKLKKSLRGRDLVGRVGGDEFMILLKDIPSTIALERVKALVNSMRNNVGSIHMTVSIGVSVYPDQGRTFEGLYRNADIALYESKRMGRNQFQVYTDSMKNQTYVPSSSPID